QAITMMVEMFSDMQREQVGLIRQEVDRLHQITEEIHALQTELARHPDGGVPASPQSAAAPPAPGPAAALHSAEFADVVAKLDDFTPARVPPTGTADSATPVLSPELLTQPANAAGKQPALDLPPHGGHVDGEVHVWLYDKIAELQRERQGRLQK